VLAWSAGWVVWTVGPTAGLAAPWALGLGLALSSALALGCSSAWRRGIAAAGFPLSALALGAAGAMPAWAWALAALPLLLLYPLRAWRDAPFFPTPLAALRGLDAVVNPAPQRVLDAGCGAGHGLHALAALWPQAAVQGVEWSRLLACVARWRCPGLQVRRGDMWADDWGAFDLVYLFQRPESMPRAAAKAAAEMRPGSWLVSLEFAVPGWVPQACLTQGRDRPVWAYRMPAPAEAVHPTGAAPHSTTRRRRR
jgi:SAM-dependent methyltransferase